MRADPSLQREGSRARLARRSVAVSLPSLAARDWVAAWQPRRLLRLWGTLWRPFCGRLPKAGDSGLGRWSGTVIWDGTAAAIQIRGFG